MPEAYKYEQNKTGNTDIDYEHINREKQGLLQDLKMIESLESFH